MTASGWRRPRRSLPANGAWPARRHSFASIALAALVASALAACSAQHPAGPTALAAEPFPAISLATSIATPTGTWAIVQTGGPSVGGRFWQLLLRPAGASAWRLVTPPGVADNGGLVVAAAGKAGLTAGFVPNQLLKFTPLASTTDDGGHWAQGLLPAGLTAAPSALAALPDGRLLAVTAKGALESGLGDSAWRTLVTLRALASVPGGRACGLVKLTAAATSPAGHPLLAGQCGRPGVAEVFEQQASGWHAIGLTMLGQLARQPVTVLQLVGFGSMTLALLAVGRDGDERVLPAWLTGATLTPALGETLTSKGSQVTSQFVAASGASGVVSDGQANFGAPAGNGAEFSVEPVKLPAANAIVALAAGAPAGSAQSLTALVPGLDTVAIWQQTKAGAWHRTQVVGIPSAPS